MEYWQGKWFGQKADNDLIAANDDVEILDLESWIWPRLGQATAQPKLDLTASSSPLSR